MKTKVRNHWPEPKSITWRYSLDLVKIARERVNKYWDKTLLNAKPGEKLITIKSKGLDDAELDILKI